MKRLLFGAALAALPLLAPAENLLPGGMPAVTGERTLSGWRVEGAKGNFTLRAAEDGQSIRFVPEGSPASVSLYAPAVKLPDDALGIASAQLRGEGRIRLFAVDSGWKKLPGWDNRPQAGGEYRKLTPGAFRFFGAGFLSPNEPSRKFCWRLDIEADSPVEFRAPALTVRPLTGGNLLGDVPFTAQAWELSADRKSPAAAETTPEGIRLAPESGAMFATLYAPALPLPPGTVVTGSVRAKGSGTLRLFATRADWKKDAVWGTTHRQSAEFALSPEYRTFNFQFPAPEPGGKTRFRIDVKSKAPVELAAPELTAQTFEATAEAAAKKKSAAGALKPKELFPELFRETAEKPLRLTPECSRRFEFPEARDLSAGSLAFRFRFDNDLWFEPLYRGFWEFEGTQLASRLAHARIHFGRKYFGLSQRIFGGEWHHAVYTWNAETGFCIFIDGRIAYVDGSPLARETARALSFGKTRREPGFAGEVAGVRLYDRELSDEAVSELYAGFRQLTPFPLDYAATAGGERRFRIGFDNPSGLPARKRCRVTVEDSGGKRLFDGTLEVSAAPHSYVLREIAFTPEREEDLTLAITDEEGDRLSFRLAILDPGSVTAAMKPGPVRRRCVAEADCTASPDPERYRDDGKCRVTESPAGRYRETGERTLNSGFAYRFTIENPGRPHWVEFEFPDDRPRTFYCAAGAIYNEKLNAPFLDACGVITGGNFPLSNTMQTRRFQFVPDSKEFAVLFGSHHNPNGEAGPAVAKIRILELEGELPKLDLDPDGRRIMIWNEDPTMTAYTWFKQYRWNAGTTNFDFWRDKLRRMVQYTRYIGWSEWNMLCYDYLGDNTSGDRRLVSSSYGASGGFLPGHLDMLAVTAEREGIPFYLSLNHLSGWSNNLPAGLALETGRGTISRDFFEAAARGSEAPELFSAEDKLAEIRNRALNPIHPAVRAALRRMFRAYAEKFGRYRSFRGLDCQATEPLHFSDPKYGYGDYTAGLFRRETGVPLPEFTGIRRFSQRYGWLRENAWERWIDWRCGKVAELAEELVKELGGHRLILRVTLGRLKTAAPYLERGELPDLRKLYREQGLDLDRLAAIPNVTVMPDLRPNYTRIAGSAADERTLNFSDRLAALWSNPAVTAAQVTQHSNLEIHNSISQTTIRNLWNAATPVSFSTPLPPGNHVLENFAWLVANTDAQLINHGWWGTPEAGAEEEFRAFYRAFSRIPRRAGTKLPGVNDPVSARQSGDTLWLVNQCAFPAKVSLAGRGTFRLTDLVTGEGADPAAVEVPGFGLRVLRQDTATPVERVAQQPPAELLRSVEERLGRVTHPNAVSRRAETLFRAGRTAAANYALQHRLLAEQLNRGPFRFRLFFDPARTAFRAEIENLEARELAGELQAAGAAPVPVRLAPGERREFELRRLAQMPGNGETVTFEAGFRTGGRTENRRCRFQPLVLRHGRNTPVLTLDSRNPKQLLPGYGKREEFRAHLSGGWTAEGISLELRVEDRDFLPPRSAAKMWEDDSVVVYFDQRNDAREGVAGYGEDDTPFRIGLAGGRATVLRGEPPRPDAEVRCSIRHGDGETVYTLFFPKSSLPFVKFEPGSVCGFSVEVINRFRDGSRTVLAPHPEAPHRTPHVWSDLVFGGTE